MRAAPTPLSELRPDVPAPVEAVIARAMQKNPEARYQDAAEMARDIAQCRAVAGRSRSAAASSSSSSSASGSMDFFASTLAADSTQLIDRPPEGLGISPLFDSTAGLQRLLNAETEPPPAKPPRVRLGWLAWAAAYTLAGVGAIAIAFG
jgi:hypothetical protein